MDQSLEESLNLESAMGVDFNHSEDVAISQSDIILQHTTSEEIPMEYESTEEHSMLMDTQSEEIIDFIADPLTLQEYILQNESGSDMATLDPHHGLSSQSDTVIDLQFEPQATITAIKPHAAEQEQQPKVITVKAVTSVPSSIKRHDTAVLTTVPRQVAIAPKPPSLTQKQYTMSKHMAIAPKPVTLVTNRSALTNVVKKVSIAGVSHANTKGSSVLAQIGKQLIMVPSGAQKIKLVTSGSGPGVQYITADTSQAQLVTNKNVNVQQNKPVLTKLFSVQGNSEAEAANPPVVITKLLADGGAKAAQPRYVTVHHKPVPLSIANKVLLSTPSKQITSTAKKGEIITIHAPNAVMPKIASVSGASPGKEQKVLISANPAKNVMLKPAPQTKTAQITKNTNVIIDGQQTQLHQINVPGKGVQYIRLITNPPPPAPLPAPVTIKPQPAVVINMPNAPPKTFVLTDSKGNLIHMTAEKMTTGQPPSLVMTNRPAAAKLSKAPQRLVRIAPVAAAPHSNTHQRPSQSLLAPMSPVATRAVDSEHCELLEQPEEVEIEVPLLESKESLRDLVQASVGSAGGDDGTVLMHRECEDSGEETSGRGSSGAVDEHDLIVIPSNYDDMYHDKHDDDRNDRMMSVNIEGETMNAYQPPTTPVPSESDMVSTELGLRPRKACNCTKSQCLKLYCDCFASGEFCNNCNCNNCHNNLENEELRQKAIRGCLDRNPNAFRPKIGKTKSGGPEIVRRHNKGCNCKRSGCLKNYCECYEAKIACTAICKCVGCRNVEDGLDRNLCYDDAPSRRYSPRCLRLPPPRYDQQRYEPSRGRAVPAKEPGRFMTSEVIEAVCQCLVAVAVDRREEPGADPVRDVLDEFARCLQDVISTARQEPAPPDQEVA